MVRIELTFHILLWQDRIPIAPGNSGTQASGCKFRDFIMADLLQRYVPSGLSEDRFATFVSAILPYAHCLPDVPVMFERSVQAALYQALYGRLSGAFSTSQGRI